MCQQFPSDFSGVFPFWKAEGKLLKPPVSTYFYTYKTCLLFRQSVAGNTCQCQTLALGQILFLVYINEICWWYSTAPIPCHGKWGWQFSTPKWSRYTVCMRDQVLVGYGVQSLEMSSGTHDMLQKVALMQIFSLHRIMQNISFLMSPRSPSGFTITLALNSPMFCIILCKLKSAFQSLVSNNCCRIL